MPRIILAQNSFLVSSVGSTQSVDFTFNVPNDLTVPLDSWFETSQLHIRHSSYWQIKPVDEVAFRDRGFLNPTIYKAGHAVVQANGFVVENFPLKYESFNHNYDFPTINISGSQSVIPITLGRTADSAADHVVTVGEQRICGTITPPTPPAPQYLDATIPEGAFCGRLLKGAEFFDQLERKFLTGNETIVIDSNNYGLQLSLSGILRPGFEMEVLSVYSYLTEFSGVAISGTGAVLTGDAPFPVYGYGCALGAPVPSLLNPQCVPGGLTVFVDPVTGQVQYGCGNG